MKKHKEWCDISNKGVTNFGVPPNIFRRSTIRFDGFHMNKANGALLLEGVRLLMNKYTYKLLPDFVSYIRNELKWCRFAVERFENNKRPSAYQGKMILQFTMDSQKIVNWIEKRIKAGNKFIMVF